MRYSSALAFGELLANVVRHAPGLVRVLASTEGDGIAQLIVDDSGAGFVPVDRALDPHAETGRGLGLVRGVADGVRIERTSRGGTRVNVTFRPLAPALASSAGAN